MSSPFTLRPLTATDEPLLWTMLYHAVHVPPGHAPPAPDIVQVPELARYVADWKSHPDDLGVAAEVDGTPVGAAWLRRLGKGPVRGYGFIDAATPELTIAVLPDHRGRGIGTALLTALLDTARTRFAALSLSVSLANPAKRLYERLGFVEVAAPAGGSVTMRRPL
ncbi:MAG: GNAT family N-acetyltransferase [Bacteroidota bacterium]